MSTAWISGIAGQAIVVQDVEGEPVYLRLDAGSATPPVPSSSSHLRHLLKMAPDLEEIRDPGPPPFDTVSYALERAWRQDRALALGLTAVDGNMPDELRARAAAQANDLLADAVTRTTVRNRLLGTPLPEVADLSKLPRGTTIHDLFAEARSAHDRVESARRAWHTAFGVLFSLDVKLSSSFLEDVVEPACIVRGGYAALVDAGRVGSSRVFEDWLYANSNLAPFNRAGVTVFLKEWHAQAAYMQDRADTLALRALRPWKAPKATEPVKRLMQRATALAVERIAGLTRRGTTKPEFEGVKKHEGDPWGYQLIIDCFGCTEEICSDLDNGYEFLDRICEFLHMSKQTQPYIFKTCEKVFPGRPGYSGWIRGIQIHTSAMNRFVSIDLYSTRAFDQSDVEKFVIDWFQPEVVDTQFFYRGRDFLRRSFASGPHTKAEEIPIP
ncbi:MAG TPA: hypothetical protein VGG06_01210 [Thermoanaerobaculia bacterium]